MVALTSDLTRRAAIAGMAAGAGVGLAGRSWYSDAEQRPLEVDRIRLLVDPNRKILCWGPQYLATEFLRMEGFREVEHVAWTSGKAEEEMLADGEIDLTATPIWDPIKQIDLRAPVTILGGLHAGCIEVFASERIAGLKDLRGARILTSGEISLNRNFLMTVLAYIGIDPHSEVEWVYDSDRTRWPDMLIGGEVDVVSAFTALNYILRERKAGHVILNTTLDDPWRHFFCCVIAANRDFVERAPVATFRALRALAKAQQLCHVDPDSAARRLVGLGATKRLDLAIQAMRDIPYGTWFDFDPAASVQFFALRLREAGLIASSPNEILGRGAAFHFFDDLRREMKL